jgi:lysophospholipase L1-like esterase
VLLARIAAIALGILLPLVLFELSLRVIGPWPPGAYDTGAYVERDERLGHVHVRGYQGWYKTAEFTTFISISPLGLRDRRTDYEKAPGTFRVLLLGDSFLEGIQVQQADGVAERLEALLNEAGLGRVEVINAGVTAYGTGQEVLFYEQDVRRYRPDLVVLLCYVANDVKNNSYRLEIPGERRDLALKPYFDLDRAGRLQLLPGPPPRPVQPLVRVARACCWTYNLLEGNLFARLGPPFQREGLEVVGGARNTFREVFDTTPNETWSQAWRITEALLGRLRDDARTDGAPFMIVGVPDWRSLTDDVWRRALAGSRLLDGRASPDAPTDRLGEVARRLGTPYLNLLPVYRQRTQVGDGPFYFTEDGHWNNAGHAVAAQTIADTLRTLELVRR